MTSDEARTWAVYCHLSGLLGFFLGGLNFLMPLILWLLKAKLEPYIEEQGRSAVNFNLSVFIYSLILIPISLKFGMWPLYLLLAIAAVMPVIAAIKCNRGENFHYPMAINFIEKRNNSK